MIDCTSCRIAQSAAVVISTTVIFMDCARILPSARINRKLDVVRHRPLQRRRQRRPTTIHLRRIGHIPTLGASAPTSFRRTPDPARASESEGGATSTRDDGRRADGPHFSQMVDFYGPCGAWIRTSSFGWQKAALCKSGRTC